MHTHLTRAVAVDAKVPYFVTQSLTTWKFGGPFEDMVLAHASVYVLAHLTDTRS